MQVTQFKFCINFKICSFMSGRFQSEIKLFFSLVADNRTSIKHIPQIIIKTTSSEYCMVKKSIIIKL